MPPASPEPVGAVARPADEADERIVLAIGGMTCAACARRVEKALARTPGVDDAVVNLATHRATVVYQPAVTAPAALAAAVAGAGYRASPTGGGEERVAEARALAIRALIALVIGAPVIAIAMAGVDVSPWLMRGLAAAVLIDGLPIVRAAAAALRRGAVDMNVLVTLGALASLGHGDADATVAIVGFVLCGRWLEARARWRAGASLGRLQRLVPPTAIARIDGRDERVLVERLVAGDVVVVRPGAIVPVDGEVIEGASSVAEAVLTGEAMPIDKRAGDRVFAGTCNQRGVLLVRATGDAAATTLAGIVAAVERAMGSRAPAARLADRVAGVLVPAVLGAAALTFAAWLALGHPIDRALDAAIAVLVVACPCALGLATPTALVVGLGRAAEAGVLFASAAALERLGSVDTVVIDKTGTLTEGQPLVVDGLGDDALLARVAGVEQGSEHPIAGAFLRAAGARGVAIAAVTDFASTPGRGVRARVDGRTLAVGNRAFAIEHASRDATLDTAAIEARGLTPVIAVDDGTIAGVFGVGDAPRAGAADAIARLRALRLEVVMLSGDTPAVAARVAGELGIARAIGGASPEAKAREIAALRADGGRVAMVGDGVNDAPALAAADVGVAMASATDVAAASAAVVLLGDDLAALPRAIGLARATLRVVRQNLGWAFAYNALALPAAATGLLTPMLAAAAMSLSSVSVVLSSLRLRRMRAEP